MFKGTLSKLNDVLKNNNIEVLDIKGNKQIKLNHITYVIISNHHFYTIDKEGFRTSEISIKPSILLEKLQNEIQKHINNKVVEIKIVGNINSFQSKSYNDILNDYIRIKKRYDKGLKYNLPNKYKEVCDTLDKLKKGYTIKFISGLKEHKYLISEFGKMLGSKEIIFMRNTI